MNGSQWWSMHVCSLPFQVLPLLYQSFSNERDSEVTRTMVVSYLCFLPYYIYNYIYAITDVGPLFLRSFETLCFDLYLDAMHR
jgi:hypothetical protein